MVTETVVLPTYLFYVVSMLQIVLEMSVDLFPDNDLIILV